jgi:hypothetical protein
LSTLRALGPPRLDREVLVTPDKHALSFEAEEEDGRIMELDGHELFGQIAEMGLDGIVFNCAGPTRPRAFAAAFASLILAAGGSGEE